MPNKNLKTLIGQSDAYENLNANWIDDDEGWVEKNVKKIYDGFDFLKD